MRQVTRKGLITMAAAGGVLALGGGYAHADAGAAGAASGSPGCSPGTRSRPRSTYPSTSAETPWTSAVCSTPRAATTAETDLRIPDTLASRTTVRRPVTAPGAGRPVTRTRATAGRGPAGTVLPAPRPRPRRPGPRNPLRQPGAGAGGDPREPLRQQHHRRRTAQPGLRQLLRERHGAAHPPVVPRTPHTPEKPVTPHTPPAPETQLVAGEQLAHTGGGGLGVLIPASAGMLLAGAGTVLYRRSRSAA